MGEEHDGRRNVSTHILPTASNLLGLCFVILSFLRASGYHARTLLDETVVAGMILFLASSLFSYGSLRSQRAGKALEKAADVLFLLGLCSLALISLAISLSVVR